MATRNPTTANQAGFTQRCKDDGVCPTLGYEALEAFSALKQLFAAFAIITLSCLSVWLSWRLGELLNAGGNIFEYYPLMLASMSLIGFYLAGYVATHGISKPAKCTAFFWLALLVSLDLFAAWTIMCAADHVRVENADQSKITQLHQNISREEKKVTYWDDQAEQTTMFKSAYSRKAENAKKSRDDYQSQLDAITQETFTSARAVFYKTPVLRDDPEYWMTVMRLYIAAVSVLTVFVCPALIVIDLRARRSPGGSPAPKGTKRKWWKRDTQNTTPATTIPASSGGNVYAFSPATVSGSNVDAEKARRLLDTFAETLPTDLDDRVSDFNELLEVVERLIREERVRPSQPAIKRLGIGSDKATALQAAMRKRGVLAKNKAGHHVLVDAMRLTA